MGVPTQPRFAPQIETTHRKDGSTHWRVCVGGIELWSCRYLDPSADERRRALLLRADAVVEARGIVHALDLLGQALEGCEGREGYTELRSLLSGVALSLGGRRCLAALAGQMFTAWLVEHA